MPRFTLLIVLVCAASAVACGGGGGPEPASPPVFNVVPSVAPLGGPVQEVTVPASAPPLVRGGPMPVGGHLEGQLRGIDFDTDTAQNSGNFELWEGGGGYVSLTIAAEGAPAGAGMLIVGIMGSRLDAELDGGRWSSADGASGDALAAVDVNSCSGPGMDNLSWELPAKTYEVEASADPDQPGMVVVVARATFSRSDSDAAESELTGTFRFGRLSELPGSSTRELAPR